MAALNRLQLGANCSKPIDDVLDGLSFILNGLYGVAIMVKIDHDIVRCSHNDEHGEVGAANHPLKL